MFLGFLESFLQAVDQCNKALLCGIEAWPSGTTRPRCLPRRCVLVGLSLGAPFRSLAITEALLKKVKRIVEENNTKTLIIRQGKEGKVLFNEGSFKGPLICFTLTPNDPGPRRPLSFRVKGPI